MVEDKYIGLALAILSTLAIGSSFVITKKSRYKIEELLLTQLRKGLNEASERDGFEGEGFAYLKNPTWWGGIITLAVGEVSNFAAYAFAPAILVTPLGALSVLIGAVLGSYFLHERLGTLGKFGCAICLIGSVVIIMHAPADKRIDNINELLDYAIQPGFLIYCIVVGVFASVMIYRVSPKYGKKNPLVYLSICSTVGSISVMSIKAFGIALKLTLGGNNQFKFASTYVFVIVVVVCILTQMNYFNKALSQFSTNIVNPLYYVTFTTSTLCASFILFRGFNTTDATNTISLLCGFFIIFAGVYLLNLSREDPDAHKAMTGHNDENGIPTDGIAGYHTRASMQLRRSSEALARRMSAGRSSSFNNVSLSDRDRLIHNYDEYSAGYPRGGQTRGSDEAIDEEGEIGLPNGSSRVNGDPLETPPQSSKAVEANEARR